MNYLVHLHNEQPTAIKQPINTIPINNINNMCCKCHHSCRRPRRGPFFVQLGKFAYKKYQEHQAQRLIENGTQIQQLSAAGSQSRSTFADDKLGAAAAVSRPPSYYDAIVAQDEKAFDAIEDVSRNPVGESSYGYVSGMSKGNIEARGLYEDDRESGCQSRCQQKRAAKAARKADYWAARAREASLQTR